jgi:7-cyano-7-deazaguanine synthase
VSEIAPAATRPAVTLLSGGLDSTTTLAIARRDGFDCFALTIDYGQRHRVELDAARAVAERLGARDHVIVPLDLRRFGGSALTADIAVPKGREPALMTDIPVTYVPARNTIFLALALAWAETLGAEDIFIGVNALDSSGYPDCRPEYIDAFERLANLGTRAGVQGRSSFTIHTPLIALTKADIVRQAVDLGVDLSLTWSCYDPRPDGRPCTTCDSCILREKGFREAGLPDPTREQQGQTL